LTAEEIKMSDATFSNTWDMEVAAKIRKSRINRGIIEDVISPGYCKSGKQCIRYGMDEKRHPAFKQGKSGYCSRNCSESHRARAKRSEESILASSNYRAERRIPDLTLATPPFVRVPERAGDTDPVYGQPDDTLVFATF